MPQSEVLVRPEAMEEPIDDLARRRWMRVGWLAVAALVASAAWMTIGVGGEWDFALPRRGMKLAGLAVVGTAVGYSTVLFQTITSNRILTPSIMGFDRLFALMQTLAVFFVGSTALSRLDPRLLFVVETTFLSFFAVILFRWIFTRGDHGLYTLVLVGIVFGTMFASVSSLLVRLIDPNEFDRLMDRLFATFNTLDESLLLISALVVAATLLYGSRYIATLDVLSLGREHAIALGVDYQKVVTRILVVITVLVAVSTALVGPITFLGLLVANLAYQIVGSHKHRYVLPAAALIGMVALIGGQTILERVFTFNATLGSIIEVVGGIYLIALLMKEATE